MNKEQLFDFVFEDGEEYTHFYFHNRRNKMQSVCAKVGEDITALANYASITIESKNQRVKTALISGVCTHPNERGKGVMQTLLSNLLFQLKSLNFDVAVLSPVNDDYYTKYGFESLVKGDFMPIKYCGYGDYSLKNATKIDTNLIIELYNQNIVTSYFETLSTGIALDLIDEFSMGNGKISFVLNGTNPIGWIATDGGKIEIAVLPDLSILEKLKEVDGFSLFSPNNNGTKDLFQIKYLNENAPRINLNDVQILNKY